MLTSKKKTQRVKAKLEIPSFSTILANGMKKTEQNHF